MQSNLIGLLAVMFVYMAFMVAIGFYFSKESKDTSDFYLGGRKLGPLVTAMSAEASDMSSWLLMGLPGVAYLSGVADAGWTAIGLAVGTYLNWLIVSRRLRRYSERVGAITIPDFLSRRYHEERPVLMAVTAIVIVVFFTPYTASGFAACGKLFSTLFGIGYMPAMIASAVIIVAYTALGGFLAASTTDLIQSIVMSIALVSVVVFGVGVAGGLDAVVQNAQSLPGYLGLFTTHDVASGESVPHTALTIASTMAWGLGYFGMPHILLRFMGIEDEEKLVTSRRIATIWVVIAMSVAIFIGIIGNAMSKAGAVPTMTESGESEKLIVMCAMLLSQHGALAMLVGGLILAGILACTMSTSDSQLLATSSSISENIMRSCLGIKLDTRQSMVAARVTVLLVALVGVFLARNPDSSVFLIVSFAWAGFGASFGPAMLLSLFWRRTTRNGVLAGIVAGGAMVFVWKYGIASLGGAFAIYELLPAFVTSAVVTVAVSLAGRPPADEVLQEFDGV